MIAIFQRYTFKIILLAALTIRIAIAIIGNSNEIWATFADDLGREQFAETIVREGLIFQLDIVKSPESVFAPGVPVVLALFKVIFGNSWFPVFLLNAIIGASTCLVIFLISKEYFDEKVSLLALIWAAFYPGFIRYTASAGNEPWIVFLFSLTFLFAIRSIRTVRHGMNILLFALFFALLFHFDERYIIYSLIFPFFLLLGEESFISKIKKLTVFILLTVLFSIPWLVRNYIVYKDIVLISCRTNNLTESVFHQRKELIFFEHIRNDYYISPEQIDSVKNGLLKNFPGGKQINKSQVDAMKSGLIPHSFSGSEKILSRLWFLWMPFKFKDSYRITGYEFSLKWSLKHNIISILSYGILLPAALLGIIVLIRRKYTTLVLLFCATLVFHTLVHVIFIPYTRDRYRHPVDFIVIILGCLGFILIYDYLKKLRNKTIKAGCAERY